MIKTILPSLKKFWDLQEDFLPDENSSGLLEVLCPAFFQESGRGAGAEPMLFGQRMNPFCCVGVGGKEGGERG